MYYYNIIIPGIFVRASQEYNDIASGLFAKAS